MSYLYGWHTCTDVMHVRMSYLYWGHTCTDDIPVRKSYMYWCHTCTEVIPVRMTYMYGCHICTDVIPVLMSYMYECHTCMHVKTLRMCWFIAIRNAWHRPVNKLPIWSIVNSKKISSAGNSISRKQSQLGNTKNVVYNLKLCTLRNYHRTNV